MLRYPRRTSVVLLCLMSLAIGLAIVRDSLGGKPSGGGGTPAGRIYFGWSSESGDEDRGDWSMKADGTDKQLTPYQTNIRTESLSYRLHAGHRWYLEVRSSSEYPFNHSLFAVRDDGDPDFTVLLLRAEDVAANVIWLDSIRWGQDDSFISIPAIAAALRPDGSFDYDPDAFHTLYVAAIVFDDTGRPLPAMPPIAVLEGEIPGERDLSWYDWSPDGNQVAYTLWDPSSGYTLMIANLLTGQSRLLAAGGGEPTWSPDGLRIAFRYVYGSGIYTIKPDGTGELRLTTSGTSPIWSPDGKHLAYSRKSLNGPYDVYRIPATGGSAINLTKDLDGNTGVHPGFGWR